MHRLPLIIALNLLGAGLFFSWYLPLNHGIWSAVDTQIFFFFNQMAVTHPGFATALAITNQRLFDLISLLAMAMLFAQVFLRQRRLGLHEAVALGLVMLVSAIVLNQLGHLLPVSHASPSLFYRDNPAIVRISLLSGIPTKDASADSFPGDHGMMLMVFTAYMLKYAGRKAFFIALAITVLFSLPRVMIGAHWLSDIMVGSLAMVLMGMSWWLMTGTVDQLIARVILLMPPRLRRVNQ